MADPIYQRYATAGRVADQAQFDEGLRRHMLRVYNYMGGGLVVTGLLAFLVAQNAEVFELLFTTPIKWVVMLAPLAFVLALSFGVRRMSFATMQIVWWAYCGSMGLSLASIFAVYTGASITLTFFVSASTFLAMSVWGYTTKTDLSRFGSFLMMGVLGIVIASVANLLFQSSAIESVVSILGVLIFTGLTAYDTQRIKEEYAEYYDRETSGKVALMGALALYLNFINLFMFLLQFLGVRND